MSIFRNTFTKTVKDQLRTRQNALKTRSPQAIIQLNSRNSWIRMTSGVNVNGTNTLAKQYVMLGGVLNQDKSLRAGVGDSTKAYSTTSPSGTSYNTAFKAGTAGIKPMPGITAIDIKSKSAYGSLREVTVQFICHNLQQLEDLELLYMRPGYTALVEWGWVPFLDNTGQPQNNINFYDGVLNGVASNGKADRDQIFLDLFQRSKDHSGNYDALYGYVKNYNWTARMDGGYDCTATIISIGEIMESLKVGWTPLDISSIVSDGGLLNTTPTTPSDSSPISQYVAASKTDFNNVSNVLRRGQVTADLFFKNDPLAQAYSKSILAGLCYELYITCQRQVTGTTLRPISVGGYNLIACPNFPMNSDEGGIAIGNVQAYITLNDFISILNKYVLLAGGPDQNSGKPFISLSTYSNSYDDIKSEPLYCLAHKLQVSVDPTVCLITNPLWAGGVDTSDLNAGANNGSPTIYDAAARDIYNQLEKIGTGNEDPIGAALLKYIGYKQPNYSPNNAKEFVRAFAKYAKSIQPTISNGGISNKLRALQRGNNVNLETSDATYKVLFSEQTVTDVVNEDREKAAVAERLAQGNTSGFGVQYLKDLGVAGKIFAVDYEKEVGEIGNIYLNLDFLYRVATNPNTQTNQELKLYKYLKTILSEVQESIGGVNNFDIHVDPVDSVARIIDINYVDTIARSVRYDESDNNDGNKAFQIEMSNLSSTVRSYNINSQIFPEQASIVAIGAQVGGGGAQASQNNTLLDFNNNLTDRIITKKFTPSASLTPLSANENEAKQQIIQKLKTDLDKLKDVFLPINDSVESQNDKIADGSPSQPSPNLTSEYKGALRDVIRYFQGVTSSNTKNRAIIPIKASITMDGIGGLIIGHLFKIPSDLLPKGYKEDSIGGKLLQVITGIAHKVGSGDWVTTIDAYNIIASDPKSTYDIGFDQLISLNPVTGETVIGASANTVVSNLQLSGDYASRAAKFIKSKEGFLEIPEPDTDRKLRGGYGSPILYTADRKVVQLTTSTRFTQADADRTLIYLIQTDFTSRVIRNIGQNSWNELNDNQRAALISYAYNVGNINKLVSSIKTKDFIKTASLIKDGPITANGKVVEGLRIRREQEAALFSKTV
jgi:GH24 family phage-related lysozyme (muramidase)